jgi:ribosome assembly protein YihI (activator of Der GTPase)
MGMEEQTCLHSKPAEKRRKKKEKKNHGINPGQHHLKYTEADSAIENAEADFSIE